jgi:hypothetical protein
MRGLLIIGAASGLGRNIAETMRRHLLSSHRLVFVL